MNAKDRAKMKRLETENAELRQRLDKHMDVYRDQALELIDLRARIEALRSVLDEEGE